MRLLFRYGAQPAIRHPATTCLWLVRRSFDPLTSDSTRSHSTTVILLTSNEVTSSVSDSPTEIRSPGHPFHAEKAEPVISTSGYPIPRRRELAEVTWKICRSDCRRLSNRRRVMSGIRVASTRCRQWWVRIDYPCREYSLSAVMGKNRLSVSRVLVVGSDG
jgi:hypothetical protein